MLKLDLGRKNIVFLYIILEIVCLACCSIQQNSNLNQDGLNFDTETLLQVDKIIGLLESVIPNVAQNCADGLELSPFMDIQPGDTLNKENFFSPQVEFKQLTRSERYAEPIDKYKGIDYGALLNCKYKYPEQTYSKMYLGHLKTLKESGKMHRRATVFQDLHPSDKLSYLQKNPPITGSIFPDEPKIILRRKKPNLFAEATKKVEIGKGEPRKSEKSLFDMVDGQKSKLRKMHSQDQYLRRLISSYDLVLEELKAKLKSIKDKDSGRREERLQAISEKLSGYKRLVDDGKSILDDLERSQAQLLNTPLLSQRAIKSRVFEQGARVENLYCWYEVIVPAKPQYCSTMKLPLNGVGKKNPVLQSGSKGTNLETSYEDKFKSHLSILSRSPKTIPSETKQNKLRWKVENTGAERSSSDNRKNGPRSGMLGGPIQHSAEGMDTYHATYVEVDDSSDEEDTINPVGPPDADPSVAQILKLLELDIDLKTNEEAVDHNQNGTGNRRTRKYTSRWRGGVNGAKKSSSGDKGGSSGHGMPGGHIQRIAEGMDTYHATYVEVDDSSDEEGKINPVGPPDEEPSVAQILKLLQLDVDPKTNEEVVDRNQDYAGNRSPAKYTSRWRSGVSGTKKSSLGNEVGHSKSKMSGVPSGVSKGVNTLHLACTDNSSDLGGTNDQDTKNLFKSKAYVLKLLQLDIDPKTNEEAVDHNQNGTGNICTRKYTSKWRGRVNGAKKSSSGDKGVSSGPGMDNYYATYVEIDDSSD
ncbi:hypothetical protein [Cryptosporidium parvum Iowa II]|uniref:Uncharacterized protein n=2 Tax=Cryptosporidium parvum TaxID=5807 RepID=Q5CTL1_CRYPI|nr:hypothetical protein [Cryptosporidium parvum Iowa II]EAK88746.1 hypothetical protein, signal peptide [Cryptosporidium parvum Iowa II]QOY42975.1 Uncharacterized protein CPATCC_0028230 [Cryptosporidium parvum]WKS76554.1 putative signal peptide protein [Cryptosporidium sp. 43IA8]WRK31047.1 Uncharacterized protein cpbgf_2002560 [Cryptosporidium parvum]|eukprot:QOY42975.1 hypothetical protein CPATCC_000672 [Cryptosporidium parvum]